MQSTSARLPGESRPISTAVIAAGMVLSGMGTTILGPILPLLAAHWHLRDSQSGLLLTAEFLGLSIGSIAIARSLRLSLLLGIGAATAGFGALARLTRPSANFFAVLPGASPADHASLYHAASFNGLPAGNLLAGLAVLFCAGFGLGLLITSNNLIAGERYRSRPGPPLTLLNFGWSLGAVLSPLLVAALTPAYSVATLLASLATAFLLLGLAASFDLRLQHAADHEPAPDRDSNTSPSDLPSDAPSDARNTAPPSDRKTSPSATPNPAPAGVSPRVLLLFAALFFLYGGVESSLNGWLTTYTLRYGRHSLSGSQSTTLLFWIALTAGRALSALVLIRIAERPLLLGSLSLAVLATSGLIFAHTLGAISLCAVLLGLSLAPCFPATLALMLEQCPRPRQAALALAVTGLGGAALTAMMGETSSRTGSLQVALLLPLAGTLALLALYLRPPWSRQQ
ncbi:MAG TPA: MFS transporter [Acidisarcina sp.]